jgi:RNA-directed DNA polymerase
LVTRFRHAACKDALIGLEEWLRRKLRSLHLKQCTRPKAIAGFLIEHGVPQWRVRLLAGTGKGWWRRSGTAPANGAMTLKRFEGQGLVSLAAHLATLQAAGNR